MFVIFWQSFIEKGRRWASWHKNSWDRQIFVKQGWNNTMQSTWRIRSCISMVFRLVNFRGLMSVSSWATLEKNVVCGKRIMISFATTVTSSRMRNVAWCWQAVMWVRTFCARLRVFNQNGSSIRNRQSKWPQVEFAHAVKYKPHFWNLVFENGVFRLQKIKNSYYYAI